MRSVTPCTPFHPLINVAFYPDDHIDRKELLTLTKTFEEFSATMLVLPVIFDGKNGHNSLICLVMRVRPLIFNQAAKGIGLTIIWLWIFYGAPSSDYAL